MATADKMTLGSPWVEGATYQVEMENGDAWRGRIVTVCEHEIAIDRVCEVHKTLKRGWVGSQPYSENPTDTLILGRGSIGTAYKISSELLGSPEDADEAYRAAYQLYHGDEGFGEAFRGIGMERGK